MLTILKTIKQVEAVTNRNIILIILYENKEMNEKKKNKRYESEKYI